MKKTIYIALLIIGGISMMVSGFALQDEILKMLNERDTLTNISGVACFGLWCLIVGICEYTIIQLIYQLYKSNKKNDTLQ